MFVGSCANCRSRERTLTGVAGVHAAALIANKEPLPPEARLVRPGFRIDIALEFLLDAVVVDGHSNVEIIADDRNQSIA